MESEFYLLVRHRTSKTVRQVIDESGLDKQLCWMYLRRWTEKGWYDYLAILDLGWLTKIAPENIE